MQRKTNYSDRKQLSKHKQKQNNNNYEKCNEKKNNCTDISNDKLMKPQTRRPLQNLERETSREKLKHKTPLGQIYLKAKTDNTQQNIKCRLETKRLYTFNGFNY